MKDTIFALALLLAGIVVYGQNPNRSARLDSLKAVVKAPEKGENRLSALEMVLKHYAAIPAVDSVVAYGAYGMTYLAGDSLSRCRTQVYRAFYTGLVMANTAQYQLAEKHYTEMKGLLADAQRLAQGNPPVLAQLSVMENKLHTNIGTLYMDNHQYPKADSCYQRLINSLRVKRDTSMLIYVLTNQAVLYMYMAMEKEKDSLEVAKHLNKLADNIQEEAIFFARVYLKMHPDDTQVRRRLMHLLSNKSATIVERKEATAEEKKELLMVLVESVFLAREHGYPGRDLLVPQTQAIMLYRVLGRYEKALETAGEVIREAHDLNLPDIEASACQARSLVYWEMEQYDAAVADAHLARELFLKTQNLTSLINLCEGMVARLGSLPMTVRHQYRLQRDVFEGLAQEYRQKAKEAGQEVPEETKQ